MVKIFHSVETFFYALETNSTTSYVCYTAHYVLTKMFATFYWPSIHCLSCGMLFKWRYFKHFMQKCWNF